MTQGFPVPPGPSIIDLIWEELLEATAEAIRTAKRAEMLGEGEGLTEAMESRGVCLGLATALAIMINPYDPDVDEIRREVMRRHKGKTKKERRK